MKQERKEELVVRWMDGALSPDERDEMNAILEAEPELQELQAGHLRMKEDLQSVFKENGDVPYGDFFQTKLAQAIRSGEGAEPVSRPSFAWRDILRWSLAPVAVGAMAVAFLAGTRVNTATDSTRTIVAKASPVVYTPEGGVTANFLDAEGSGTSVIVLDGLTPIPDTFDLMAEVPSKSQGTNGIQLITSKNERRIY